MVLDLEQQHGDLNSYGLVEQHLLYQLQQQP
jgi:hypothetical protein